jgi:hypothetical protein
MNPRLLELREQRGLLRARCAAQRRSLAEHGATLEKVCAVVDRARTGGSWIKRHPGIVGVAVLLVALKPKKVWQWTWRWGRRVWLLRQGWKMVRQRFLFMC